MTKWKREMGIVLTPVFVDRFEIVAYQEFLNEGIPLLNRFVGIPFVRAGEQGFAVGQILACRVESDLAGHPDTARKIARHGEKEAVRNILSAKTALLLECSVVSAFTAGGQRVPLDFPLKPVDRAYLLTDDVGEEIFGALKHVFSLGRFYGTEARHYLYLADFSELKEAYHTLVAGQTGSGKSTLVKMLLLGYAKNSKEMNIFVLDPVGEFTAAFKNQGAGHFVLELGKLWRAVGRKEPEVYDLGNLALESWEVFEELLVRNEVFIHIGVKHVANQSQASAFLVRELKKRYKLEKIKEAAFPEDSPPLREIVSTPSFQKSAYSTKDGQERVAEFVADDAQFSFFRAAFLEVARLFDASGKSTTVGTLVRSIPHSTGRTIVVDLSTLDWSDPVKYLLIKEILQHLYKASLETYKKTQRSDFNTLVVLDEAHRIAPPDKYLEDREYAQKAKRATVTAFVETRKFGLGWLVVSTRVSLLDHYLFEHSRVKFLGYGLGTGSDGELLREAFGSDFLRIYNQLPDPADPLAESRTHIFAVDGPICLLSKRSPELLEVYSTPERFLAANGILRSDV